MTDYKLSSIHDSLTLEASGDNEHHQKEDLAINTVWGDIKENVFSFDSKSKQILKIDTSTGIRSILGDFGGLKDVSFMWGDSVGNLFVNQAKGNIIIKFDMDGKQSVFVDEPTMPGHFTTQGLWGDTQGSLYFVASSANADISGEIRKVDTASVVTIVAGGNGDHFEDGMDDMVGNIPMDTIWFKPKTLPALNTYLKDPYAITGDLQNRLYVSRRGSFEIIVIHLDIGLVRTLATPINMRNILDGVVQNSYPLSMWADTSNNLFVGMSNSCVLKMTSPGYVAKPLLGQYTFAVKHGPAEYKVYRCDPASALADGITPAQSIWGNTAGDIFLAMPEMNVVRKLNVVPAGDDVSAAVSEATASTTAMPLITAGHNDDASITTGHSDDAITSFLALHSPLLQLLCLP